MNINDILTRMSPSTLAAFVADLDVQIAFISDLDGAPGDYDQMAVAIMEGALAELIANVGQSEAAALLAAHGVSAANPLVATAFQQEQQ